MPNQHIRYTWTQYWYASCKPAHQHRSNVTFTRLAVTFTGYGLYARQAEVDAHMAGLALPNCADTMLCHHNACCKLHPWHACMWAANHKQHCAACDLSMQTAPGHPYYQKRLPINGTTRGGAHQHHPSSVHMCNNLFLPLSLDLDAARGTVCNAPLQFDFVRLGDCAPQLGCLEDGPG